MGVKRPQPGDKTGLVLSGGGARGAYEVGLIAGIVDVLGLGPNDSPPFQIFTGTSVGAINASYLVANAHRGDLGAQGLIDAWLRLSLESHIRLELFGLGRLGRLFGRGKKTAAQTIGSALFDSSGLQDFVTSAVDWKQLNENIRAGLVDALVVAALRIYDGQSTLFSHTAPGREFLASMDPRRTAVEGPILAEHVLASAALPFIFPVRDINGQWYCDGGLRSSTPIAPAIRSGANRLVVVSLTHDARGPRMPPAPNSPYPGPVMLLGKVLNALLLDPINYDLHVLQRLNRIVGVLDDALGPRMRARVDAVTEEVRGKPYTAIETLVFNPSADLGELAGRHLREAGPIDQLGKMGAWFLRRAAREEASWEVDLASYILFDGRYAERLIEVGRRDAHRRADQIREFFGH